MNEQHYTPQNQGDGFECLVNTELKDGIRIEGHPYEDAICFEDVDTGRTYSILRCPKCNHYSVTWAEYMPEIREGHTQFTQVGG